MLVGEDEEKNAGLHVIEQRLTQPKLPPPASERVCSGIIWAMGVPNGCAKKGLMTGD